MEENSTIQENPISAKNQSTETIDPCIELL